MQSLLLLLGLAALAGLGRGDTPMGWAGMIAARADANEVRMQKLNQQLDSIASSIENLPKPVATDDLAARVQALTGDGCGEKYFQCGGDVPQCVSNLLVCDGSGDCRNGEDERNCENPAFPGTAWSGVIHWESCSAEREANIRILITADRAADFFGSIVYLDATIVLQVGDKYETENTQGYYQFGSRKLVLKPVGSKNIGLICEFDGVDATQCKGEVVQPSLYKCADVLLVRK